MRLLPAHAVWLMLALAAASGPAPLRAQNQIPPVAPPPLPVAKSPVDSFRELLGMNAGDREKFLASRPPELRKRLEAKIKEYEGMKPGDRENSLRATQLYWYLEQCIQLPATNRKEQLAAI